MDVSIDSRTIKPGQYFIPVKGENFDGRDSRVDSRRAGASGQYRYGIHLPCRGSSGAGIGPLFEPEVVIGEIAGKLSLLPPMLWHIHGTRARVVIEGRKPNTKYIVRVRAVNSCGNSPWSKGHQGTFKTLEA